MPTPWGYPYYTIGSSWSVNVDDDYGCRWGVAPGVDIMNGPAVKTHITTRPFQIGAYRAKSYLDGRTITLPGWVTCPSRQAMIAARDRFLSIFPDGGQRTLTMFDGYNHNRSLTVELSGTPTLKPFEDGRGFDWQIQMYAADPRWLDTTVQTSGPTGVAGAATDGLNWAPTSTGGLNWANGSPGGLNWGTSGNSGVISLANTGTATTWPVFTVNGSVTDPIFSNPTTGYVVAYKGLVDVGQTLVLDMSPFTRSVALNGIDRLGAVISAQWLSIPPQSSITVQFAGTGTGTVSVAWQNAYL